MVKESHWFQDAAAAAAFSEKTLDRDVYFGAGLSPANNGLNRRCVAAEISGVGAIWVDIDVASGVHKKNNLPETTEQAFELLNECGVEPSIIVNSGGGLQAYWLFNKFCLFSGPEEKQAIRDLSEKWNYYFKELAARSGWDIDSTYDLARVMRVPGTKNFKSEIPRPVELLEFNPARKVDPADLTALMDTIGVKIPDAVKSVRAPAPGLVAAIDGLVLDPAAKYDPDLFEALTDIEPKFLASWNHRRKDFNDQSCSSYDLSLATFWLNASFTDQSAVDMLIQHRRKFGNPKLDGRGNLSLDYYRRTLIRARTGPEELSRVQFEQAQEETDAPPAGTEPAQRIETPADRLEKLSKELGIKITGVYRVMGDPPHFRFDLESCSVNLPDAGFIVSQTKFRDKIATASKRVMKAFSKERWFLISQRILDSCIDEIPDPLETPAGFLRFYIKEYLESREIVAHSALEAKNGDPFHWRGFAWITIPRFSEWLKRRELSGPPKFSEFLNKAGFEKDIRNVGDSANSTTKVAWRVPLDIYQLPEGD